MYAFFFYKYSVMEITCLLGLISQLNNIFTLFSLSRNDVQKYSIHKCHLPFFLCFIYTNCLQSFILVDVLVKIRFSQIVLVLCSFSIASLAHL